MNTVTHARTPAPQTTRCGAESAVSTWWREHVTCVHCLDAMQKWDDLHGFKARETKAPGGALVRRPASDHNP
jgi:hypothetical protein